MSTMEWSLLITIIAILLTAALGFIVFKQNSKHSKLTSTDARFAEQTSLIIALGTEMRSEMSARFAEQTSLIIAFGTEMRSEMSAMRAEQTELISALRSDMNTRFTNVDTRFAEQSSLISALRTDMNTRFTNVDARFTNIDTRFTSMDARFTNIDTRFASMDTRFTSMDARFTNIDTRFAEQNRQMDARHAELRGDIQGLRESSEGLNGRVHNLETAAAFFGWSGRGTGTCASDTAGSHLKPTPAFFSAAPPPSPSGVVSRRLRIQHGGLRCRWPCWFSGGGGW